MKMHERVSIKFLAAGLMVLWLCGGLFAAGDILVNFRFYEGLRGNDIPETSVVTSYYLRPLFVGNIVSDMGLDQEKEELKRIFNLENEPAEKIIHLRPIIVVVSDVPGEALTVKGWAGPLASFISKEFNINRHRMLWIEYYPPVLYGNRNKKYIPEKFEVVEFAWKDGTAVHPQWRLLQPPLLNVVRDLVHDN